MCRCHFSVFVPGNICISSVHDCSIWCNDIQWWVLFLQHVKDDYCILLPEFTIFFAYRRWFGVCLCILHLFMILDYLDKTSCWMSSWLLPWTTWLMRRAWTRHRKSRRKKTRGRREPGNWRHKVNDWISVSIIQLTTNRIMR